MNSICDFLLSGAMVSTINSFFSSVLQEFFPNHYMMTGGAPGTGSGTTTGSGSGTTTGSGNNTTSSDNKATTGGNTVPESTDTDISDTPSFSSASTDSEDLDTFSNPKDSVEDRISQLEQDIKRLNAKKDDFSNGKIDPLPGKTREESAKIYNSKAVFKLQERDSLQNKPDRKYMN